MKAIIVSNTDSVISQTGVSRQFSDSFYTVMCHPLNNEHVFYTGHGFGGLKHW